MLNSSEAIATIAVKDLKIAAKFYEDTLGLKKESAEGEEQITYRTSRSLLSVYRSEYAGTNKATTVTWIADDLENVVSKLKDKGVAFEHYDMPDLTLQGDVHVGMDMKVAWFKDPDGNIHCIVNR